MQVTRRRQAAIGVACLVLALAAPRSRAGAQTPDAPVHHDIIVTLDPPSGGIEVEDRIALPADIARRLNGGLVFTLGTTLAINHVVDAALRPDSPPATNDPPKESDATLREYTLQSNPDSSQLIEGPASVTLRYRGAIRHSFEREEDEYARSFARTHGIICERGVVLSGASGWVPRFGDRLVTFALEIRLPAKWDAVSQGDRRERSEGAGGVRRVRWECSQPMEEIHLVAAPFEEYSRAAGRVTARAFLRTADPQLADRYLSATAQYIEMYEGLIGPYPYGQFSLVENFWETGYGMPGFTLLGEKVIRFPFILHSSYPHEILHNWWGNSVYVAAEGGNWCEGLTAYLADHLFKEGVQAGIEYRRDLLVAFRNHVHSGRDFPLSEFSERHSAATEAVGYGKSLMLWHMLRMNLGDERFIDALRRVYSEMRFRRASFNDLARIFGVAAGEDLGPFFRQWTLRTGAPGLALGALQITHEDPNGRGACRVRVEIRQAYDGEPFALEVPVAFTLPGEANARLVTFAQATALAEHEISLPAAPLAVAVDPRFDLFRRLERAEIPPTFGQIFGAKQVTIVLPDAATPSDAAAPNAAPGAAEWEQVARGWAESKESEVSIVRAGEIASLPTSGAVWIFGSANSWARSLAAELDARGASFESEIRLPGTNLERSGHSFAVALENPRDAEAAIGWLGSEVAAALPGLARKLPHYGRYSYLAFEGEEPKNVAKGQWSIHDSPLVRVLAPANEVQPKAPPDAAPLARVAPAFEAERLLAHVRVLAAEDCEGRGVGSAGHERAAQYIAGCFERAGLAPAGDGGGWFQSWEEPEGPEGKSVQLQNVIGVLRGTSEQLRAAPVYVAAHYDHLGRGWPEARAGAAGEIHNGADDNASGISVLIEVAAHLAAKPPPPRSIVFVAFDGEEWGRRGSLRLVRGEVSGAAKAHAQQQAAAALAMINLDCVGRLGARPITVLGAGSATEWAHIARGIQYTTGIASQCIENDPGGSDQVSFQEIGVPAIQIFSGMHDDYHRPTDDVDKIDAAGLVKVAMFLREAVEYLAAREAPLTPPAAAGDSGQADARQTARKVTLGTVPDFAYTGPGVRLAEITEGSPAAAAGMRAGDILVAIDGKELADLRAFAAELRARAAGDLLRLRVRRGADELNIEAKLVAR